MTDIDPKNQDTIRESIIDRFRESGLTCADLAKRCDDEPGYHAISRYLQGRTSLNSRYVSILAKALGMRSVRIY